MKGPGSTLPAGTMSLARVTGPGLPGAGVVYAVSSSTAIPTMDLWNKTGSLTTGGLCGTAGSLSNCPNLWLTRTPDITGAGAGTLAPNPANNANLLLWAQPGDGFTASAFVKGAKYKIELFYGTGITDSSTPNVVVYKTLLSDLIPATQGVNLPWNTPGPQTLAALDPAGALAGQQTALPVDWVQNINAQQISGLQAVVNATSGSYGPTKWVPRGATSAVLDNQVVPAFTTSTIRTILMSHRMLDGSSKTTVYTYN